MLIAYGACLVPASISHHVDGDPQPGCTPLHMAALRGHGHVAALILRAWYEMEAALLPVAATGAAAAGAGEVGGGRGGPVGAGAAAPRSGTAAAAAAAAHYRCPDPRRVGDLARRLPADDARRGGHPHLAEGLLDPLVPIAHLFDGRDEMWARGQARMLGPHRLAVVAALALHRSLLDRLDQLQSENAAASAATANPQQQDKTAAARRHAAADCDAGGVAATAVRSSSSDSHGDVTIRVAYGGLIRSSSTKVAATTVGGEAAVMIAAAAADGAAVAAPSPAAPPPPPPLPINELPDACGVCLEPVLDVRMASCGHGMCLPCARRLCNHFVLNPARCPYCRTYITGFGPNAVPLRST